MWVADQGGRLKPMVETLDGNSIGGLLIDVFGAEMTAAISTCGTCGAVRPVAELVIYRRAPRHRRPLPNLRRRTHGVRRSARRECRRPDRDGQLERGSPGFIQPTGHEQASVPDRANRRVRRK
jgi:hypothetical protein